MTKTPESVNIINNEPMDGRPWIVEQAGPGWYVLRLNEDGTSTTMATADNEDAAYDFLMAAITA
jgi:hypothetical protein